MSSITREMASSQVDFVTLGMFIIDDIYPPSEAESQKPQLNVVGGAGTYSAVGARILSPPPLSRSVACIVDAGTDFTPELRTVIESWDTGSLIRQRDAPTTRGWNGYSGNQHRAFKYLTEKKRLTAEDLTPELLASRSFHLICSPHRCIKEVSAILDRRQKEFGLAADMPQPIIIWEPVPDLCVADELDNTLQALKYVDVISPNHEELASLFSSSHDAGVSKSVVEEHAQKLLKSGIGPVGHGAVVVRAGAEGCYVLSSHANQWLPAYHQDATKVIDPTGGGNGFLGGLAVGLVRTEFNLVESALWGGVSASFCIEQVGMPRLDAPSKGDEKWNGGSVQARLNEYRSRLGIEQPAPL